MKVKLGFTLYLKLYKRGQLVERTHLYFNRDRIQIGRKSDRRFSWEDGGSTRRFIEQTKPTQVER